MKFFKEDQFNWIALKLTTIISVIFVFELFFPDSAFFFALDSSQVLLKPYTLVTYSFLHVNLSHLFSNMFFLVIFGTILEKVVGPKNFLFVYFISAIFSGLVGIFFYSIPVVGASGAIFGVMATLAVLRPLLIVYVGAPLPMIALMILYAILAIAQATSPNSDPLIANVGHLAGIGIGVVLGIYYYPDFKEKKIKTKKVKLDEKKHREWEDLWLKHQSGNDFSPVDSRIARTDN